MGKLKNIVHLSKEQLETLLLTGKVTADGITVNYTPDDVHVIPIAEYNKFMTTDTQQVITGAKDFRGGIMANGEPISMKLYKHSIFINAMMEAITAQYYITIFSTSSTAYESLEEFSNSSLANGSYIPAYNDVDMIQTLLYFAKNYVRDILKEDYMSFDVFLEDIVTEV